MTTSTIPATMSNLAGTYVLDPAHTRIGFVARHAMVTKVRGQFNEFEGSAVVDADDFTRSSAQLTIQAASIDTRNAQRDAHLRSNDFLAMEEFPDITFVATRVDPTGPDARFGSWRSGGLDRGDLELECDFVTDQDAAGLERGVPGDAVVLPVDDRRALEADAQVAERVGGRTLELERDRDRVGDAPDGQVAG